MSLPAGKAGDGAEDAGDADLHAHSRHSDGALAPRDLVRRAAAAGLAALALTDHDGVDGIAEAEAEARATGLTLIPGIEISAAAAGAEIHLLAWHIDPADPALALALEDMRQARERRLLLLLAALAAAGAPISEAQVRTQANGSPVGRPHVARALVAAGYASGQQEAFDRWIGRRAPAFVPLSRLEAGEAMRIVRRAGGVAGIAHPGLGVTDETIALLAGEGLTALEVDHPAHTARQRAHYAALATRCGLVPTGGSDFHAPGGTRHADLGSARVGAPILARLASRRP